MVFLSDSQAKPKNLIAAHKLAFALFTAALSEENALIRTKISRPLIKKHPEHLHLIRKIFGAIIAPHCDIPAVELLQATEKLKSDQNVDFGDGFKTLFRSWKGAFPSVQFTGDLDEDILFICDNIEDERRNLNNLLAELYCSLNELRNFGVRLQLFSLYSADSRCADDMAYEILELTTGLPLWQAKIAARTFLVKGYSADDIEY